MNTLIRSLFADTDVPGEECSRNRPFLREPFRRQQATGPVSRGISLLEGGTVLREA